MVIKVAENGVTPPNLVSIKNVVSIKERGQCNNAPEEVRCTRALIRHPAAVIN